MASKTITISKDVYDKLKKMKRPDESFTQVISRLVEKKGDPAKILNFFQNLSNEEEKRFKELADNLESITKNRKNIVMRDLDV